jgi:FemAB-related protein (PEP-CTERM system-associated)
VSADTLTVDTVETPPGDWDAYVTGHGDSSAWQLAAAVAIGATCFGLRSYFLGARDAGGRLRGVLPVVEQRLVPGTRCLVSLPFCTYGGALADDEAALAALLQAAEELAARRGADRILLRHSRPVPAISWAQSLDKVSMLLPLPDSVAELQKKLGSKLRSQIRRADRENPEVRIGGAELLADFYPVFCSVMRDLGTPVYPLRFFAAVCAALQSRVSVVVIYLAGEPVSGAILVQWRDGMEVPWAATLGRVKSLSVNMRLYWELLQLALTRGCRCFDFGRSSVDAGTYRFKSQWGAQPVQLHWHCWSQGAAEAVAGPQDGRSRLALAVRLWSRMPLPVANWLGPIISPYLPW